MTNRSNRVIYTGITSDLIKRVYEHKNKLVRGFTEKYNVDELVYFEQFTDPRSAIAREKQIKAGSRKKKIDLIEKGNPNYNDLYNEIIK